MTVRVLGLVLALGLALVPAVAGAELMIIGVDQKIGWDENAKQIFKPPGNDAVVVVDITDRETPKIVGSLPLMNTIIGPPTNLAITPDERLALVANSMNWVQESGAWKPTPDNKIYVIDLKASPPSHVATVEGGKQPSGMAIARTGDFALVANRADNSISVLSIQGNDVKVTDTVSIGEQVASVAISPDGKRAFATKFPGHKVAVLDINGGKVTYSKYDMPVGQWPYNVAVTPDGSLAISADNGNSGQPDGNIDTVSVIDAQASPPRVIDRVVVGDAPEGLVISPRGDVAVAVLLGAGTVPKTTWFYKRNGSVAVLKIDGKKVTKVGEVPVGGLPEGVVFSSDGRYLYVGNYLDNDVSILKVDGATVTDTGKRLKLPGAPASMRGRNP